MKPTRTLARLSVHLAERRAHKALRREHDEAMLDPRVAVEHHIAIQQSVEDGHSGCLFCR